MSEASSEIAVGLPDFVYCMAEKPQITRIGAAAEGTDLLRYSAVRGST